MANYSELLDQINDAIYENNDQEIDALEVRAILREMVTSLGSGFLFKGIATPSSPSGTGTYEPDQNVFYLATTAGTYTYLGGLVVAAGEVAFLCFDGTWTKKPSALLSTGSIVDNLTTNDATKPLSAKQGKVLADAGAATAAEVTALGQKVNEFNMVGIGNTSATHIKYNLVPGRKYRIIPKNPQWNISSITTNYLFTVRSVDSAAVNTYLWQISRTDARPAYYDITIPGNSERIVFTIKADAGEIVWFNIIDITEIDVALSDSSTAKSGLSYLSDGVVPISYTKSSGVVVSSGNIASSLYYYHSNPILLKPGWTIAVDTKGYNFAPIAESPDQAGTTPYSVLVYIPGPGDEVTLHTYKYKNDTDANKYIVVSFKNNDGERVYFDDGAQKVVDLEGLILGASGIIPETISLLETSYVATARNYILRNEVVNGVDTLFYSKDCGNTWVSTPNNIGNIVFVHWFLDGTCLIAGDHAVYTTKDGLTFTQSAIFDENGNSFTPTYNAFYYLGNYNSPYYEIDGKEAIVWNDYGISSGYVSRIWYSDDKGATIRCICTDGITLDTNGNVINVRHFHNTFVDESGNVWVTSGDMGNECKVIKGYLSNNVWSFDVLASGNDWKLGQCWIKGKYFYAITDYTEAGYATGIIRIPVSLIGDNSSIEYVTKMSDNKPVTGYFEDEDGTRIILPDGSGYKKLYLARHNFDFKKVSIVMTDNLAPMVLIGPNYNGECIVNGINGYSTTQPLQLNHKRYLLSAALRRAGVASFASTKNLQK